MSSKLLTTTTTATATTYHSLTFLSLRFLQSQAPPPNPLHPPLPFLLPALHPPPRPFTTTTAPLKKTGGKQNAKRPPPNLPPSKNDVDVHDFTDYKDAIAKTQLALREDVGKVKPGGLGRDLEGLEGVRVTLENEGGGKGSGSGNNGRAVRLGDLAQVVPRGGKSVNVLVGEKEHVKPILSALALPPHALTAQPSPTEPLTLTIPVPPITQEARQEAAKVITQRGEAALFALREARGAQRKKLRALEIGKMEGEDELKRAGKEVERMNEGAVGEAKRVVEEGRRRVLGR